VDNSECLTENYMELTVPLLAWRNLETPLKPS